MHTRIACRISVIKRIDSRMWLAIESAGPRNWTTYISRQSSNNTVQLHFESVEKPHPTKKKQTKIALIYLFFRVQFSQHFLNFKFLYETQFSRCPVKYSKIELLKVRFADNLCNRLIWLFGFEWVSSLSLGLGFGLQAYLSQKFFLCANRLLHIVYLLLLLVLQLLLLLLFVMPIKVVKYLLMF